MEREGKPCRLVRFAGCNLARLLVGCRYFRSPTLHFHVCDAFLSTRDCDPGQWSFQGRLTGGTSLEAPRASLMDVGVGAALRPNNRSAAPFDSTLFLAAIAV